MRLFLIVSFLLILQFVNATQQQDDLIIYKNDTCALQTHWAYPSPFEVYYQINPKLKYPFTMLHTANYRGHIATWKIENGSFYLEKIEREGKNKKLKKYFKNKVNNNRVFADWFTGFILIKASPFKQWYDSPYSDDQYYVVNYHSFVIVEIFQGKVISENNYDTEAFWDIVRKYHDNKPISIEDKIVLSKYYSYLDSFRPPEEEKEEEPYYTEEDFDFFLIRHYKDTIVSVPLTDFCIVKGATFAEDQFGYFIERDFRISDTLAILMIEMGASNVPRGPWDKYSSGAVLLVVNIDTLSSKSINLAEVVNSKYRHVNNFGGVKEEKYIEGTINIKIKNDSISILTGNIFFKTKNPETLQEIKLNNSNIPTYTIKEYLDIHKNDSELFKYDPIERYKEIEEKTIDYNKNR